MKGGDPVPNVRDNLAQKYKEENVIGTKNIDEDVRGFASHA